MTLIDATKHQGHKKHVRFVGGPLDEQTAELPISWLAVDVEGGRYFASGETYGVWHWEEGS